MFYDEETFMKFFTSKEQEKIIDGTARCLYNMPSEQEYHTFSTHFVLSSEMFDKFDDLCEKLLNIYIKRYFLDEGNEKYDYYVTITPHASYPETIRIKFVDCYIRYHIYKKG